jgi:hypothetical protein
MSALRQSRESLAEACIGALPECLSRIREPQRRLAIWERRIPAGISAWLARDFRPPGGDCRGALLPDGDASTVLDALLKPAFGSDGDDPAFCASFQQWKRDLQDLIVLAKRVAPQTSGLMLRLQRLEDAGCPLFHVDRVPLRLLCVYLGAGTEWLPEDAVDRSRLGTGSNASVRDWSAVQRIGSGHVAVMKGDRYPGNAGRGLVHRSPDASPAQPRILAAIDFG